MLISCFGCLIKECFTTFTKSLCEIKDKITNVACNLLCVQPRNSITNNFYSKLKKEAEQQIIYTYEERLSISEKLQALKTKNDTDYINCELTMLKQEAICICEKMLLISKELEVNDKEINEAKNNESIKNKKNINENEEMLLDHKEMRRRHAENLKNIDKKLEDSNKKLEDLNKAKNSERRNYRTANGNTKKDGTPYSDKVPYFKNGEIVIPADWDKSFEWFLKS